MPSYRGALRGLLVILALVVGALAASPAHAADELDGFRPDNIVSDANMYTAGTEMSAAQIQTFLEAQAPGCATGADGAPCLQDARFSTPNRPATPYCAKPYQGATNERASAIIAKTAVACGINPEVLIVMLQKEQGLVKTSRPTRYMYAHALGFRCPDFLPCEPQYDGFVNQVYFGASRLQEYKARPGSFTFAKDRRSKINYSPYDSCGGSHLTPRTHATAALYNYTPFTPNQASLDAGAAAVTNSACGAYGNRNFYRYFRAWFDATPNDLSLQNPVAAPRTWWPEPSYRDVGTSTAFFHEIEWITEVGISTGWADGTYRPLTPINRDAMAAYLYRAAGEPAYTPPRTSPFRDVPTTHPFYREITWAEDAGITTGWADGTYRPLTPINRDAMAAFLYRAAGSPSFTPPRTSPFRDVSPSHPFYREIAWTSATGISTGWADRTYRPLTPINRDAMAAFVYRAEN